MANLADAADGSYRDNEAHVFIANDPHFCTKFDSRSPSESHKICVRN